MEFAFTVAGLQDGAITLWDAAALVRLSSVEFHKLRMLLEDFGQRSAVAQGLRAPITDIWRLRSSDQQLYLQTAPAPSGSLTTLLGGLKVGRKKLFCHRADGAIAEIEPLCVLDFYVHEQHQRQGVGRALFECMLESQQLGAEQLGYDRPSAKLLAFLHRHYGLGRYIPQPNNFVVFEQFYSASGSPAGGRNSSSSSRHTAAHGAGGSSSGGWATIGSAAAGSGLACSGAVGNGRQTLHIIGSRAAAAAAGSAAASPAPAERWLPTSVRPPTPSLQHSVHLMSPTAAGGHGGGARSSGGSGSGSPSNAACILASITAAGAWSALGGAGCPTAGCPSHRDVPDDAGGAQLAASAAWEQQLQLQPAVQYTRGQGIRALVHTRATPASAANSHAAYQQALFAAAANPAPPLATKPGDGTSAVWRGSSAAGAGLRDSLDALASVGRGAAAATLHGRPSGDMSRSCSGSLRQQEPGCGSSGVGWSAPLQQQQQQQQQRRQQQQQQWHDYAPVPPYASLEPKAGTLLPQDVQDGERVSLRKQAAEQAQQRYAQTLPPWVAAGAAPAGQLIAAPQASYAVPTAGMAGMLLAGDGSLSSSSSSRGRQGGGGGRGSSAVVHLSWDGLPTKAFLAPEPAGQLSTPRGVAAGSQRDCASRAAAAHARAGSGAASCLRMV